MSIQRKSFDKDKKGFDKIIDDLSLYKGCLITGHYTCNHTDPFTTRVNIMIHSTSRKSSRPYFASLAVVGGL